MSTETERRRPFPGAAYLTDEEYGQAMRGELSPTAAADLAMERKGTPRPTHLWSCGCLRNDAGAHRVGCPDHPEGVRG